MDLDVYIAIAANIQESGWSKVLTELDKETFAKLKIALDSLKDVVEVKEEVPKGDATVGIKFLNEKFDKVTLALKGHRKRLEQIDLRLSNLEENRGTAGISVSSPLAADPNPRKVARKPRPLKSMTDEVKEKEKESDVVDKSRRHQYQFGSRKIQVAVPTQGYPTEKEIKEPPKATLELTFSHGYNGNSDDARQNLYLTPNGKYLLYFIAAVCVRHNLEDNTQAFFKLHNDDITTICIDPREGSTLAASGQKDPKDEPGQGKDLPKIWIWNWETMQKVKLIDEVCWGKIGRVQWSKSGHLYCIGGDEDQTLKAWHADDFKGQGKPNELISQPTMKEEIHGFKLNPNPNSQFVDEFVMFGKRKFGHVVISKLKDSLQFKSKMVTIGELNKEGEKAFFCCEFLPNDTYCVGSASGAAYICKGGMALECIRLHEKPVGDLLWDGKYLISGGFDKVLKKWSLKEKEKEKEKKGGSLEEKWSKKIEVAKSDLQFLPKAIAYNQAKDIVYCGTKTNQICAIQMKTEATSVVVDGHDGQVWALCTHPELPIYATGGYDNAVKLWDAKQKKCFQTFEFPLEEGEKQGKKVACASWSNSGKYIAFGTEDSYIMVFRYDPFELLLTKQIPPKSKNAEIEPISYLRFSEDSILLAAAHMDSNLYIFSVNDKDKNKFLLESWDPLPHVAAPTNLQFSADGNMIKTLTRDYEVVHWELNRSTKKGKFRPSIPDPDKLKWGGDPLIAGWDVEGLYQKGWDGTDLNDCSVTQDGKYVASGDDYGTVRLHPYPAIVPEVHHAYRGHAEFVVGVEFLRDDSQLITCGGNDMAIFQWTLKK